MSYEAITVERGAHGVVTLVLDRPQKKNALSAQMMDELSHFAANPQARVVVLKGAGDIFCAGGDLAWMQAQMKANRQTRMIEARRLAETLFALNTMRCPLIGAIHGGAYGGAIGLISVCDLVIVTPDCRFALTETKLGLIPATISPYVIARMGEARAREVFMSAKVFDANEALRLGLVSKIATPRELNTAVDVEIAPYLNTAPPAVAEAKALARALGPKITPEVINATIERLADVWESEEAAEGIAAFFEKRKPIWVEK